MAMAMAMATWSIVFSSPIAPGQAAVDIKMQTVINGDTGSLILT